MFDLKASLLIFVKFPLFFPSTVFVSVSRNLTEILVKNQINCRGSKVHAYQVTSCGAIDTLCAPGRVKSNGPPAPVPRPPSTTVIKTKCLEVQEPPVLTCAKITQHPNQNSSFNKLGLHLDQTRKPYSARLIFCIVLTDNTNLF